MRFLILSLLLLVTACTKAPYRLPYPNGTAVFVTQDDSTHSTPKAKMYDFRAPQPGVALVAAKEGWVRFIKDSGNSNSATNNYVWIEHPLNYCQPSDSVPPGGQSGCRNCAEGLGRCNEWSAYIHMEQGSVAAAGLQEGMWVAAGTPIGIEGDVGFADCGGSTDPDCGRHGHFHVWTMKEAVLSGTKSPNENGDYETYIETFGGREERVPAFCTSNGLRRALQGNTYVAANCPN